MALHVPKAPGMAQMMKEGARYFRGLEEAVFRNISACKQFAQTVRTAYGPNGMNKMVINHIEKLFVTNDAATIIKELEVEHPAAKLMILASQMQEQEIGDGTNFVIIFSGALLESAEDLLRMGLTPSEIVDGYELALEKALEILPTLTCYEIKDYRNETEVSKGIKTAIMSKQYGNEDFLTSLISRACVSILPEKTTFNVDNIRVCKILGSGVHNSQVVQGMVFKRNVEGDVTKKSQAKVAVYSCPLDITQTERRRRPRRRARPPPRSRRRSHAHRSVGAPARALPNLWDVCCCLLDLLRRHQELTGVGGRGVGVLTFQVQLVGLYIRLWIFGSRQKALFTLHESKKPKHYVSDMNASAKSDIMLW